MFFAMWPSIDFFVGGVNLSMCSEGAVFCITYPSVVWALVILDVIRPVYLSKCSIGSLASSMVLCFGIFAGGCSFRGIFHLVFCVLAVCPWAEAFCPTILVLWCFSAW